MIQATYEWRRLPNGPRLAVATLPDSECAAVSIHIPAGSRDEPSQPSGLAHFVEHMSFKGTERRGVRDLTFAIESMGGQINACTSEDQTVYEGRGEAELLPILADVLADMVWHSTFPELEIDLERDVICEEITMYRESPADHIGDLASKALWGDHPLGNAIAGTLESVDQIKRPHLLEFRNAHHFREDLVIAAAGPFTADDLEAVIRPHLPTTFHKAIQSIPFDRSRISHAGRAVDQRDTDQLQLSLAWHVPGRHDPSRHALRLLSMLLGETASSRLYLLLREERGLCYQVSSDVTLFRETGAFEIHAGLDPAASDEALRQIHREIEQLIAHGPREGELERAKRLVLTHSKLALETTPSHAAWAGEGLLDFNRIPSIAEWRANIAAVTNADIQSVAREIFINPPATAEIRPIS